MSDKMALFRESIETGEIVDIIYSGGSQPGTVRGVQPRKVEGNHLWAFDTSVNKVKQFIIDKIEIFVAEKNKGITKYDPSKKPVPEPETLTDAIKPYLNELENSGFHLIFNDDSITIHDYFKNGKPKKGALAGITYYEFTSNLEYDEEADDVVEVETTNKRPWYVHCNKSGAAVSFSSLGNASRRFMEHVRGLTQS